MTIRPASDRAVLVRFGEEISVEAHRQVLRLMVALGGPESGILNLHPGYASVLIDFDPRRRTHSDIEQLILERMKTAAAALPEGRTVEVPVEYGGDCGPDLEEVARYAGMTAERVVELHAWAEYLVYFLGFSPGFPYLGGMPPELATPRLAAPRKTVPAGSVAIGGAQTGIYPMASPGGWRIIGRTPLQLFDADARPPALLRMGDRVRFVPVEPRR